MSDIYSKVNPILRNAMKRIYMDRRPLDKNQRTVVRVERVHDKAFCEIWFMTEGCSHDRLGGCTMCNYGKGHRVSNELILQELEHKLAELPSDLEELIVTPTGSMLDDDEVPATLRKQILALLSEICCEDFLIETRADTVTASKLDELKTMRGAKRINIEIGVECTDPWILRNCVNKNMDIQDLQNAIDLIHEKGMFACANIGIGIPMLSESIGVKLAQASLRKIFELGFDNAVLFPYHIKPGTLAQYLYEENMYSCCSLWAIPEILSTLPREYLSHVTISWYRNYYTDPSKIVQSPTTCPLCRDEVLSLLDDYKNYPSLEALKPLFNYPCTCHRQWRHTMQTHLSESVDMDHIEQVYHLLSEISDGTMEELEEELAFIKHTYVKDFKC